jgi:hypothetical protein
VAPRTPISGFFQGGRPAVSQLQALDTASSYINRALIEGSHLEPLGPNIHPSKGALYPMMGVELHAGEVLRGLVMLGLSMNKTALTALMAEGNQWVWDIRDFTPRGPPRSALAERMSGSGEEAYYRPRQPNLPRYGSGFRTWRREAEMAWSAVRKASRARSSAIAMAGGGHVSGLGRFADDDRAILETRDALMRGVGGANIEKVKWGGEETGSLWASIAVRGVQDPQGGVVEVTAYSNNFYAGYVNNGFEHGLVPVVRQTKRGDGKLGGFRNKIWAILSIEWLGAYDIWEHTSSPRTKKGEGNETGQTEGFAFTGSGHQGDQLTPGEGFVGFAKRNDGQANIKILATKSEVGVRFFEKGTEVFLGRVLPRWRADVDAIIRRTWDEGKSFSANDKLYQRRVRKGFQGGNRPGTYAPK